MFKFNYCPVRETQNNNRLSSSTLIETNEPSSWIPGTLFDERIDDDVSCTRTRSEAWTWRRALSWYSVSKGKNKKKKKKKRKEIKRSVYLAAWKTEYRVSFYPEHFNILWTQSTKSEKEGEKRSWSDVRGRGCRATTFTLLFLCRSLCHRLLPLLLLLRLLLLLFALLFLWPLSYLGLGRFDLHEPVSIRGYRHQWKTRLVITLWAWLSNRDFCKPNRSLLIETPGRPRLEATVITNCNCGLIRDSRRRFISASSSSSSSSSSFFSHCSKSFSLKNRILTV